MFRVHQRCPLLLVRSSLIFCRDRVRNSVPELLDPPEKHVSGLKGTGRKVSELLGSKRLDFTCSDVTRLHRDEASIWRRPKTMHILER